MKKHSWIITLKPIQELYKSQEVLIEVQFNSKIVRLDLINFMEFLQYSAY